MSNSRRHWIQQMSTLFAPAPNFRYRLDTQWSQADPAKSPVNDCHEMVQVPDGRLFLLTNHPQNNVLIYDTSGKLLDAWTLSLKGAHGLTHHDGHLYLTDTSSGRVLKTTLEGRIELELPKPADVAFSVQRRVMHLSTLRAAGGGGAAQPGLTARQQMQRGARGGEAPRQSSTQPA